MVSDKRNKKVFSKKYADEKDSELCMHEQTFMSLVLIIYLCEKLLCEAASFRMS